MTLGIALRQKNFRSFPLLPSVSSGNTWQDNFNRTTLNPTNSYPIYTSAVSTTGTVALSLGLCVLTTAASANEYAKITSSELFFEPFGYSPDTRNTINFDFIFQTTADITGLEFFVGLIIPTDTANVIPTTARHLGIYLDQSAGNNLILSSGDASTQATTDTGTAIAASTIYRIRISYTGSNSAVIQFFTGVSTDGIGTLIATHTVTAIGAGVMMKKALVMAEGADAEVLNLVGWGFSVP